MPQYNVTSNTLIVHIQQVKGKDNIDAEQIESEVREAIEEQKAVLEKGNRGWRKRTKNI
nr:hypothetical protein [Bacillus sp. WMMC1349]